MATKKKGAATIIVKERPAQAVVVTTAKKRRAPAAKKSTATKKKRKGAPRASGGILGGFTAVDGAIAGGVAVGYGMLQASADEAVKKDSKTEDYKWFREAPMITPLGRAGTIAAAGWGVMLLWPKSRKYLRGATVGMTAVAGVGLGRRKLEFYEEKEARNALMGGIGDDLAMGGVSDDDVRRHGEVDIDVT